MRPRALAWIAAVLLACGTSTHCDFAQAQSIQDALKGLLRGTVPTVPSQAASKTTEPAARTLGTLLGTQSTEEEISVGEGVAAKVLGAAPLWGRADVQRYVNLVGRTVASQSERKDLPWAFGVIDTSAVNAFAAPGGLILVTRGLYEMLESEDELAAILAHEIAHVNRQHHYNVIKQQKVVEVGADVATRGRGSEQVVSKLANAGAEILARGLDKSAEFEADRDAMILAARAGYDSSALVGVLGKMSERSGAEPAFQLLFKTHPSPIDRLSELAAVANDQVEAAAVRSPAAGRIGQIGR